MSGVRLARLVPAARPITPPTPPESSPAVPEVPVPAPPPPAGTPLPPAGNGDSDDPCAGPSSQAAAGGAPITAGLAVLRRRAV